MSLSPSLRYSFKTPNREYAREAHLSPTQARYSDLGYRFTRIEDTIEADKINKGEEVAITLRLVDERAKQEHFASEERLNVLKNNVMRLQQKVVNEVFDERKSKEIKLLENNMKIELLALKHRRKDVTQNLLTKVDEELYGVVIDVAREKANLDRELENATTDIIREMTYLKEDLEYEKKKRAENFEILVLKMEEEIEKFQERIELERTTREETENVLFNMLEEIDEKLQEELTRERIDRETAEQHVLELLEDTCIRIEKKTLG